MKNNCVICGCKIHRGGEYATPTIEGRSHTTKHHYVAERYFGRSANRKREQRKPIFSECPWNIEGKTNEFCYECHEELLHNPVLLPTDVSKFAELVKLRGWNETTKTTRRNKIAGRIRLLHEVIEHGIEELLITEKRRKT